MTTHNLALAVQSSPPTAQRGADSLGAVSEPGSQRHRLPLESQPPRPVPPALRCVHWAFVAAPGDRQPLVYSPAAPRIGRRFPSVSRRKAAISTLCNVTPMLARRHPPIRASRAVGTRGIAWLPLTNASQAGPGQEPARHPRVRSGKVRDAHPCPTTHKTRACSRPEVLGVS